MSETKDVEANQQDLEAKTKVPCPYWLVMIPYALTFLLLTYISWKYIDVDRIEWRYPLFCYIFAACCIVQWCYLLWERWYFYGPNGFLRNLLVLSYGAIAYSSSHLSTSSQSSGTVNVPYALPSCILLDRFDYISILR